MQEKFKGETPAQVQAVVNAMSNDVQSMKRSLESEDAARRLEQHFGTSNLTELTDELTRLAPADQLRSANRLIQKVGSVERANDAVDRYLKSGVGKPACLLADAAKGRATKPLATMIGYEDRLEFQAETPELAVVLAKMDTDFASVRSFPLVQFKRVFGRLGALYSDWYVHVRSFIEKTRLRRAARGCDGRLERPGDSAARLVGRRDERAAGRSHTALASALDPCRPTQIPNSFICTAKRVTTINSTCTITNNRIGDRSMPPRLGKMWRMGSRNGAVI